MNGYVQDYLFGLMFGSEGLSFEDKEQTIKTALEKVESDITWLYEDLKRKYDPEEEDE